MQLNEFQNRFKDLMLDHPDALKNPPEDLAAFCQEGEIPLADRLAVYRNNIVRSLTDVIVSFFPTIEKLVGLQFLEGMARSFILENPPKQGCLSFYGRGFAEFVDGFELAKSLPYLSDVARLELAMNESYYAQDDEALTAEGLSQIAPEALGETKLSLRTSIQLIYSRWPLLKIQEFCAQENPQGTLDMDQGGVKVVVFRSDLDTQLLELSDDEYEILTLLQNEKTLGEAVEKTLENHPEFDFQSFLQKQLSLETFKAF